MNNVINIIVITVRVHKISTFFLLCLQDPKAGRRSEYKKIIPLCLQDPKAGRRSEYKKIIPLCLQDPKAGRRSEYKKYTSAYKTRKQVAGQSTQTAPPPPHTHTIFPANKKLILRHSY